MTAQEKNFVLDGMVRDFCQLGKCPKSEVRRRIAEYTTAAAKEAREEAIRECTEVAVDALHNGTGVIGPILALLEKQ